MPQVPGFLPSTSGFQFSNNGFPDGTPAKTIDFLGQTITIGDAGKGLCGGMVFAARDYFQSGSPPPPDTNAPTSGVLFDFLVTRLINSWDLPEGAAKYYKWMLTPDHDTGIRPFIRRGLAWKTIRDDWPNIRADIDAGRVSPLGLVCTKSENPADLGDNHQVLAYGYDLQGTNLVINVYDPNRPRDDGLTLSLDIRRPRHTTPITYIREVHGFFRADYGFSPPPPVDHAEPLPPDETVPPPAMNEQNVRVWVGARGGWPLVRGDADMDTDGRDVVPVICNTRLIRTDTALEVEIDFRCEEQRGDHTTFEGTQTYPVYQAPAGQRIADVRLAGGAAVGLSGETRGRNHNVNPFDTTGMYWDTLGFCVDSKHDDDSAAVGVEGWLVATVVLAAA